MRQLIGLPYSPWSEKARWALAHHRVEHRFVQHQPMLGELKLRMLAGRLTTPVSVPLMVEDLDGRRVVFDDSYAIACRAEAIGGGAPLMANAATGEIERWNDLGERALGSLRWLLLRRLRADHDALVEALPPFVPGPLRSAMTPVARMGTDFIARKYADKTSGIDEATAEATAAACLSAIADALGSRRYLRETFSYADIAAAVCLQMVKPVDRKFIRLAPATERLWTHPRLAERFSSLIDWRDRLYADHR